jgi:ADP-heptose:LPS heptosyltransferase
VKPKRILVVRTDRMGDVILATPLVRELRRTFPNAFIGVLLRSYTKPVFDNNPHINAVITDDGTENFWQQVKMLRRYKFDTALLLHPTKRAAYLLFCAGIKTRVGVGHKLYEVITFMKSVSRNKYVPLRHEADYCMDLGRAVGVKTDNLAAEVFVTDSEKKTARSFLASAGVEPQHCVIGLHASSGGSCPNWTPECYATLAEKLVREKNIKLVFTDADARFRSVFAKAIDAGAIDVIGKSTLRSLAGLLSEIQLFFSTSTGPMHFAGAVGTPTLSLFCEFPMVSPTLWRPQGNGRNAHFLMPPAGFCQVGCEIDTHRCTLVAITPDAAFEAIMKLVSARKP